MTMTKHSLVEINMGSNYDAEDVEVMQTIHRYKRIHQRPFPSWSEVLRIFLSLGYRKVAEKQPLPAPGEPFLLPLDTDSLDDVQPDHVVEVKPL